MKKKKDENKFVLSYTPVGKSTTFLREIMEAIPPQFKATKRTSAIFSAIFMIVILIGVANSIMPFMDMDLDFIINTGGNESQTFNLGISVGIPLSFFGSDTETGSQISMSPLNLIIDLTIYLLIAYIIDVLINFILSIKIMPSKEELKRRPREVQIQKRSLSDRAAEKIVKKVAEKVGGTQKKMGTVQQKAGVAQQKVEVVQQKAGTVQQKAGMVQQKAGIVQQKAVATQQKVETGQ